MSSGSRVLNDGYLLLLFLHLLAVVATFSASTVLHLALNRMRQADRISRLREAMAVVGRIGPRMPLFSLALFITGALLTEARWAWHTPWIDTGIAGLLAILLLGGLVVKPRLGAIGARLGSVAEGDIPSAISDAVNDRVLLGVHRTQPLLALAVMFIMVTKPALSGCLIALLAAATLGALSGLSQDPVAEVEIDPIS